MDLQCILIWKNCREVVRKWDLIYLYFFILCLFALTLNNLWLWVKPNSRITWMRYRSVEKYFSVQETIEFFWDVCINCFIRKWQALSHKTLVMLLGMDPAKNSDKPIPTTNPQVTFAYLKHMWKSSQKVTVFIQQKINLIIVISDTYI